MKELFERYELYGRASGFSDKYIKHVCRSIRFFDDFLQGNYDINMVTADDYRRFISYLRDRPLWEGKKGGGVRRLSGTALNTYARAVKAFFSWAFSEGIIKNNPLANVSAPRKPKTIPKTYSEKNLIAICEAADGNLRNQAILYVFLDSGIRLNELRQLTMIDIDMPAGTIKVMGKGGKERFTYLHPVTIAILNRYQNKYRRNATRNEPFFVTKEGQVLSISAIQSLLMRLGQKVGIQERLAPHKLRHTWATLSLKYGANLEYLRKMAGHSDIKTTSNAYLNARDEDIQAAHRNFSPIANLGTAIAGKEPISKNVEKLALRGKIIKTQFKQSAHDERSDAQNKPISKKHLPSSKPFPVKSNRKREISEDERRHDKGDIPIQPFYGDLYREHLRKLTDLTGELINDIENNNLEKPRRVINPERKLAFRELIKVYHAQNKSLWHYLAQHLQNELTEPPIQRQLAQIAANAVWAAMFPQRSLDTTLVDQVCERLLVLKERGTFIGKCKICEGYFFQDRSA